MGFCKCCGAPVRPSAPDGDVKYDPPFNMEYGSGYRTGKRDGYASAIDEAIAAMEDVQKNPQRIAWNETVSDAIKGAIRALKFKSGKGEL